MNKGLYIHFPFCENKCSYCNFYSVANMSKRQEYTESVIREIKKLNRYDIDTVYFGGGTPSLMSGVDLKRILDAVRSTLNVSKDAEISLEANPLTVNGSERLRELRELGINRLSLGIQSLSDAELSALGRHHTSAEAISTVEEAQKAGFENISVDLMFAIPHQSVKSFENTLDGIIDLGVQHVSVYALSIEDKTLFGVKRKRGEELYLPSEDEESEMYFLACEKLGKAGFEHYEISNFAKEGHRSRHNMKYWQSMEYIGIGASAHSYVEGVRYSTPSDINTFCNGAERENCYTNTPEDRAEEAVFLSLRLKDGLDMAKLRSEHSLVPSPDFDNTVAELIKHGFCTFENEKLSLTEKGFFVSNTIILKILDSLQNTT